MLSADHFGHPHFHVGCISVFDPVRTDESPKFGFMHRRRLSKYALPAEQPETN